MQNMPVLENVNAMAETPNPAGNITAPADADVPPQPARELTQTDHLNRRLLKSLLDNMQAAEGVAPGQNENGSNEESGNEFEE
ncbi:uncharacterized protein LOC128256781 [Drosophila gunungcola]|uniref:Uncharacterized protein n=1 Tax=Drosophila gunungcola TaxID=103775 RepID=A0A9Q0BKE1_9MUSC|nr:uncharacterized protein LOC128256781 [Drosophila gunungcola]KAI8035747.1 hypothetical protein M5D96_011497 [Drosophila gunungcola]